jgi:hypothetical protein
MDNFYIFSGAYSYGAVRKYIDPAIPLPFTLTANTSVVQVGNTITYILTDDEDQIITLSDNGAEGIFSSATVPLNAGNNYTATITYQPTLAGNSTITATPTT